LGEGSTDVGNIKAKAEPEWKFWGLYVHVCNLKVLKELYRLAKLNNGAPGIDNINFYQIEEYGVNEYLEEIQVELISKSYYPLKNRLKEICATPYSIREDSQTCKR
jgi:RNA-directed DNA polymerase